eukprot:TRINITY_DN23205_c0_g1_i1.p1 TRINITY_DN23205_c0_g1~~TRINITY_DN23205_c0_g1_i1.p1  ORF type:complete len:113 (-),score=9.77 TRINITY_DN23205_c0_g1_i1:157-495(-)
MAVPITVGCGQKPAVSVPMHKRLSPITSDHQRGNEKRKHRDLAQPPPGQLQTGGKRGRQRKKSDQRLEHPVHNGSEGKVQAHPVQVALVGCSAAGMVISRHLESAGFIQVAQ